MRHDTDRSNRRVQTRIRRGWPCALGLTMAVLILAGPVSSQEPARGQSPGTQTPPSSQTPEPTEQARVPTSHANVHKGPSSGQVVLVLVPKDTVLPIIGRRGEWIQVRLSPALRKTGMVMRWYENEDSGWMHDSTVEISEIRKR